MKRDKKAMYLGSILTDDIDNTMEINNRLADVRDTASRIKHKLQLNGN